jgi:hypothetical protein
MKHALNRSATGTVFNSKQMTLNCLEWVVVASILQLPSTLASAFAPPSHCNVGHDALIYYFPWEHLTLSPITFLRLPTSKPFRQFQIGLKLALLPPT